jgi:HAD superfamily hydrolase (TIGR01450 family)
MSSRGLLGASDHPLVADHDLVMLDLDGVVYRGAAAVPGAVDAIAEVRAGGVAVSYLTNNASRTSAEVADHLRALDIDAEDADVVTAGEAIAHIVGQAVLPGSTVLVIGGPGHTEPLHKLGLTCTNSADDQPAAVVQGFHPDVGWRALAEASYAIAAGVPWYASNADLTVPTGRGTAPGNGSLIGTVRQATGKNPQVIAGKPEPAIFTEALERSGARRPIMVGDRIDTDIVGAVRIGIDALHVLTGVHGLRDLIQLPPDQRPTFVGADLRALLVVHPPVDVTDDRSACANAVAVLDDDHIDVVEGVPGTLPAMRAIVALAWSVLDATGRLPRLASRALEH